VDKDDGFGGNPRAPMYDSVAGSTVPYKHVQYPKPWVGLTGTEINHIFAANVGYPERMMQAVEALLKEKNGG
jgi:hypothetical protein